jgi:hypothetical protein
MLKPGATCSPRKQWGDEKIIAGSVLEPASIEMVN